MSKRDPNLPRPPRPGPRPPDEFEDVMRLMDKLWAQPLPTTPDKPA